MLTTIKAFLKVELKVYNKLNVIMRLIVIPTCIWLIIKCLFFDAFTITSLIATITAAYLLVDTIKEFKSDFETFREVIYEEATNSQTKEENK